MTSVSIIDYGIGNILSVQRAVETLGIHAKLVNSPQELAQSERVILPGVGAFGNAMAQLQALNLASDKSLWDCPFHRWL